MKKQGSKKQVAKVAPVAIRNVQAAPSLITQSASFQPKVRGQVFEELLQVRRGDMAKIAFLIGVMLVFLAAAGIINSNTSFLEHVGQRLAHFMRIQ